MEELDAPGAAAAEWGGWVPPLLEYIGSRWLGGTAVAGVVGVGGPLKASPGTKRTRAYARLQNRQKPEKVKELEPELKSKSNSKAEIGVGVINAHGTGRPAVVAVEYVRGVLHGVVVPLPYY
jgi:hypothetical protein